MDRHHTMVQSMEITELGSRQIFSLENSGLAILDIDRKTSCKTGWGKAHAKGNKPATNWNQKVDELTKIREIKIGNSLNPEWYQLGE